MGSCACDCPSGYEGDACETSLSFDPTVNYLRGKPLEEDPSVGMYQPRFVLPAGEDKLYMVGVEEGYNACNGAENCPWIKEYTRTDGVWTGQFVMPKLRKGKDGTEGYNAGRYKGDLPGATWNHGAAIDAKKASLWIAQSGGGWKGCVREFDLATLTEVEPPYSGYYDASGILVEDGNGARAHRPQPPNASRAS